MGPTKTCSRRGLFRGVDRRRRRPAFWPFPLLLLKKRVLAGGLGFWPLLRPGAAGLRLGLLGGLAVGCLTGGLVALPATTAATTAALSMALSLIRCLGLDRGFSGRGWGWFCSVVMPALPGANGLFPGSRLRLHLRACAAATVGDEQQAPDSPGVKEQSKLFSRRDRQLKQRMGPESLQWARKRGCSPWARLARLPEE